MEEFKTVAVFQYPHEAHIHASRLESEGMEVFLKDELTVQVHNFLSNAVGGVKLQVRESDFEAATTMLKEDGIVADEPETPPASEILQKEKILPIARVIFILILLALLIFAGAYW